MLCFWNELKNPCLITGDDSPKQIWFSLKTLNGVLTYKYAMLFLIILQLSWHHFCINFLHVWIFSENLPNTVLFRVQLTCDHLNKLTIATHHLPYLLDVDFSPVYWRPPTPGVISHLLMLLFEPFVPVKNMCAHGDISIYLLKHFKSFWQSFPQLDQKFQVHSLLGVYHFFLRAYSWMTWKRGDTNKSMRKKMQWLQNAKFTVIFSKDTLLDDNTICLSLFCQ